MLGNSYLAILIGLGVRSASLAALVVILARTFGVGAYGAFAAAVSLATFFSTFSGFGAASLHLRDVSRDSHSYRDSLRRSVVQICWSLPGLIIVAAGLSWLLIPHVVSPISISLLVVGEILAASAAEMFMRTCQARSRFGAMAVAICVVPIVRVAIAAVLLAEIGVFTFDTWSWISFATGVAAMTTLLLLSLTGRSSGGAAVTAGWSDRLSGLSFALSSASSRVHGDADKVILARMTGTAIAGEYAIAYRLTDVLTLPIVAGVERLLPSLFRKGEGGFLYAVRTSLPRICLALIAGLILSAAVYLIAPVLPLLLTRAYEPSVHVARILALVPFSMTLWIVVRTLAATSNHEHAMGMTELGGAAFNIVAGVAAVALWGWVGAVYATYATHVVMTLTLLLWIWLSERGQAARKCLAAAPGEGTRGSP
ncbi:MAG TPA: oligosaccharide flippase family protein [Gammaproteobacteria bacterium]|nr:oligosaccharide flippase family protein [Gammaproteobacteria bacterium]